MAKDWTKEAPKKMGFLGASAMGVGGMVGGGIFAVLGIAASLGKGGTYFSFVIAGITALLTAYCLAKLSVHHKSDGGMITFLTQGFGNNWFSISLNVMAVLGYIVMLSLYSSAFGYYAAGLSKNEPWLFHTAVSFCIIVPALLNILESHHFGKIIFWIVVLKIAILVFFIGIGFVEFNPSYVALSEWPSFINLTEAGMLIFVSYEGFELIANTSEEIKYPKRNIPRAFIISVAFVILLYILVSLVTVGTLTIPQIRASQEYVLAEAARPALGQTGFLLISIAALLSTFSAVKSTLYGTSRTSARIALYRQFPKIVGKRFSGRPLVSLFGIAALALIVANTVDLKQIAIVGSAAFLTLFTFVNLSTCMHYKTLRAKLPLAIFALFAAFASLSVLIYHTIATEPLHLIPIAILYAAALLYGLIYARLRKR